MELKVRKAGNVASNLCEWTPGNGKWYLVHLSKITVNNGHTNDRKLEQHQLLNQLYNAILMDLTVTVEAHYDLTDKKLTLTL